MRTAATPGRPAPPKLTRAEASAMLLLPKADRPVLTDFAGHLRNGSRPHSEDTITGYRRHSANFLTLAGADGRAPLAELVTKPNLVRVLARIPHERASSRRNLFFAVKALGRYLADLEVIPEAQAEAIARMPFRSGHKPERHYLEPEQVEASLVSLLTAGGYDEIERLTNVAIFGTLAFTGLRNSELCHLRVEDVDFVRGVISVKNGKGGKNRVVGLPRRLEPLLAAYAEYRPVTDEPFFFVSPRGGPLNRDLLVRRFDRISKLLGVKVTAHALRRSFATATAHRNVPLDKLQVILGHADIQTTRIYIQTCSTAVAEEMRDW